MGLDPLGLDLESYTVQDVADEIREHSGLSDRVAISRSSGKLKIQSPTSASIEEVSRRANLLGDRVVLSRADTSVLALALDLCGEGKIPVLVSDDYAVQNVAEELKIAYQPLATLGIRQKFKWTLYCPACFRRYHQKSLTVCTICGTQLKRKPVQKQATKASRFKA